MKIKFVRKNEKNKEMVGVLKLANNMQTAWLTADGVFWCVNVKYEMLRWRWFDKTACHHTFLTYEEVDNIDKLLIVLLIPCLPLMLGFQLVETWNGLNLIMMWLTGSRKKYRCDKLGFSWLAVGSHLWN